MGHEVPRRQTSRELVAEYLRTQILSETLPPRTKLNINEIAEQLGVSATPAREAVQLLAGESLVQLDPYRGAHVSELSADEWEELCAMRIGLEGLAARLGAAEIDNAGLAQMRQAFAKMEQAASDGDVEEFIKADRGFHEVHYTASGRTNLWRRIISLRRAAERYTRAAYGLPDVGMEHTVSTHKELLKAVEDREPERAQGLIENELRETLEALAARLRADAGTVDVAGD